MLSFFYTRAIVLPENLPTEWVETASASVGEAVQAVKMLEPSLAHDVMAAAANAFTASHSIVLSIAGVMFVILSVLYG